MGDFFKAKPSIWLYISCYHNNKNYNSRDGGSPIIYTYKQESQISSELIRPYQTQNHEENNTSYFGHRHGGGAGRWHRRRKIPWK